MRARNPLLTCCVMFAAAAPARAQAEAGADLVKRGEYLVTTMGCSDCHTPMAFNKELGGPAPDTSRLLSGHPLGAPGPTGTVGENDMGVIGPTFTSFKLPFGTVYARNLTPDPDSGLGRWTEAQFIETIRRGKSMGAGRPLLPPMPWISVAHATDDDLRAIFAYLKSIPAIKNPVPAPSVPEPVYRQFEQMNAKIAAMVAGKRGAAKATATGKPTK